MSEVLDDDSSVYIKNDRVFNEAKMVVIVFLVDTSASMNQKTAQGTSYLDLAKNAIFTFMKVR